MMKYPLIDTPTGEDQFQRLAEAVTPLAQVSIFTMPCKAFICHYVVLPHLDTTHCVLVFFHPPDLSIF